MISVVAGRRCDGNLSLESILMFVTGARQRPILGYTVQPMIEFVEKPLGFFPTANTCANLLSLPRVGLSERPKEDHELFDLLDHTFAQQYFGRA